jgi:hypothetical protein
MSFRANSPTKFESRIEVAAGGAGFQVLGLRYGEVRDIGERRRAHGPNGNCRS